MLAPTMQTAVLRPLWIVALAPIAFAVVGCTKDLGAVCRDFEAKKLVAHCERATMNDQLRQHHVVELWNFSNPSGETGYGSLARYEEDGFNRETEDLGIVAKETGGFHYENKKRHVQVETRFPVDTGRQSVIANALDDL